MQEINWNEEAKIAVNYSSDKLFPTHRGVTTWHDDVLLVFANDGSPQIYDCLQEAFKLRGAEVLATATTSDNYSIAMLVRPKKPQGQRYIEDCLWKVWNKSQGIENGHALEQIQRQIHGQS